MSDLDGMNIWYEFRLLEEGIEDLQNLATANIVDVMCTGIPVDRLVDWIDESAVRLKPPKPFKAAKLLNSIGSESLSMPAFGFFASSRQIPTGIHTTGAG